MTQQWRPTSDIETLKARATLMRMIRQFFEDRDVMEVDTPAMSRATVTDIHLHTFNTEFVGPGFAGGIPLYLMTSPEFHMKRLLAAGSGAIYQINKAYRNEEAGRHHNPEFTMLEWYRPSFDHHALMDEMDVLLQAVMGVGQAQRMTYQEAFIDVLRVCPLEGSMEQLKAAAALLGLSDIADPEQDRDTLLQLLFSVGVEAKIGRTVPAFVYNFPASQAALARVCTDDKRVAARFEVYFKGIELANGFYELDDADEQLARFEQDNRKREMMGLKIQPIDNHLIEAIRHGLPDCAGVALGVDRLIMLALGKSHIDDVIAFPVERA
ncbi:elongation factor P lysine(34) lysyltransferase [Enterovibrio norvegicus FF-162]|uniref:Elongation factor P lysine(34) lysyltransferase n=1 Tax=Enterovibrio norvegicus FF-454 TaxID=1185651 RepID=A0A1E5C507_9GAMM|nr:elongation factor P--(R)-beta-lysine ligase [Enterovibrio norvegicus]OEE60576.1 elongation factor P lysine(34) lysyltransferase [Enterovibrio norvegicus FF-454]OEE74259.1 elongation factor P lysine(34) lysyltransferase [Enterovibrio norvegicus FF-162]